MATKQHNIITGSDLHVPGYLTATDPGTVGAGKLWMDTALGTGAWVAKIRNVTNDGWESLSGTESDPVFSAWAVANDNHTNWDTAYGWGDHSGLYDLTGIATSLVGTHESDYDHSLIATALQSLTGAWLNSSDQTLLTGDKSGSFDLTTTGDVTCDTLNYATLNPPIDLSGYLDIPCVNAPLTGNLEISKADPEFRLTDTGNSEYARLTRADTSNEFNILNRVRRNSGGYALVFNGSGWISNLDNFTNGLSEFSISLWAYPTTLSDYDGLFSSQWVNNNVSFRLYEGTAANQQLTAQVPIGTDYASVGSTAGTFTINSWYHIVVTWKSGEPVALYINNVKKEGSTKTGTLTTTNSPLIGYDSSNSARRFVGTIDQLECWNRQLTDAEVTTLYNSGTGSPYEATDLPWSSGCIRSWDMDENTGTTITDVIASDVGDFTGSGTTWGAGKVAGNYTMVEQSVLQSRTGGNENDEGVVTLGYSGSYGSKTVINGRYINFDLAGVTQFSMDTSGDLVFPDAQYTYFGTAKDSLIGFNASGLVIQSDAVTATDYLKLRGGTNGIDFFIGATEQVSLIDGVLQPTTTNDIDLGTSSLLFKNLYLEGMAYIDSDTNGLTLGEDGDVLIYANAAGALYIKPTAADTDMAINFFGTTNSGVLTWMEDEDYFYSADKWLFQDKIAFTQTDGNEYIDSLNDGYMDIGATTGIRLLQNTNVTGYVDASDGFKDNGSAGIDTTFLDQDGNTITVSGGIITAKTAP